MECVSQAPYLIYTARNDDGTLYGVCVKVYADGAVQTERDTLTVSGAITMQKDSAQKMEAFIQSL